MRLSRSRQILFRVGVVGVILALGLIAALALRGRRPEMSSDVLFTHEGDIRPMLLADLRGAQVVVPGRPHPLPPRMEDPAYRDRIDRRLTFSVTTNSRGLRGSEVADEPAEGTIRVACLGDSVTFGYGVEDDETYPAVLAELLAAHGSYEVINAGVPSHDSRQGSLVLHHRVLPLQPDVVVLCFGLNDVAYLFERPNPDIAGFRILPHRREGVARRFRESILGLIQDARFPGASVVLLAPPVTSFYSFPDADLVGEVIGALARAERLPLVDLRALLNAEEERSGLVLETDGDLQRVVRMRDGQREPLIEVTAAAERATRVSPEIYAYLDRTKEEMAVHFDGCHPNARGQRLIAEAVAPAVLEAVSRRPAQGFPAAPPAP